ncbi:hypothetical protein CCUS01_16276 [Colletotrichum cuscutae]|uniref:Uncharacterized protein n=1 Tax=Colletotrichum cuscutae TaxID=1209917 RepID=A0AAI9Y3W0_9PEZI|nr:hypothetical protein CCUS01_16276 [Colletotrichum cuscutae]
MTSQLQFEQKRRITSTRRLGVCGIYPSSIGWLAMYGLILNYIPTASSQMYTYPRGGQ